jgi:integrase
LPTIGHRPIDDIRPAEIEALLRPIWNEKPETARRVLQRLNEIFEAAIVREQRMRASPCVGIGRILGRKRAKAVDNRKSLPWRDVPAFYQGLDKRLRLTPAAKLCLQLLILTALRSEEVRLAKWGEFNIADREWHVPGHDPVERDQHGAPKARMKTGEDHIVPLSDAAMEVLQEAQQLRLENGPLALVFPARNGRPLSDNTLSKLMRDAGVPGTPHGFRSTFKTWSAEAGGVADEISEAVLAHMDRNKVRAAYRRTTFFDQRRAVMNAWGRFVHNSS